MRKYQPRIHIVKSNEDQAFSMQQEVSESFSTHFFPETQFISVLAYQNQQVSKVRGGGGEKVIASYNYYIYYIMLLANTHAAYLSDDVNNYNAPPSNR